MRISWVSFRSGFSRPLGLFLVTLAILSPTRDLPAQAAAAQFKESGLTASPLGPHHRAWTRGQPVSLPNGRVRTNVTAFIEFGVGLNRWDAQAAQWVEASNEIELFQDGAVARKTAHQVVFANNIAAPGSLDLLLPDGRRWRTQVEGLVLHDPDTGRTELVAEVRDSVGQLHPPNVIVYPDAFDNIQASVRYTLMLDRLEQDVILWEQLELPAGFGPRTRLEIWTGILEAPEHGQSVRAAGMLEDTQLDFGCMVIGSGRAFMLADPQGNSWAVPMAKSVVQTPDAHRYLVEAVEFRAIAARLNTLPAPVRGAALPPRPPARLLAAAAGGGRVFPRRERQARPGGRIEVAQAGQLGPRAMAALRPPGPAEGLVLDYSIVGTATNMVFRGDSTYYVSTASTLRGTNIAEGGAILKYASGVTLTIAGRLEFQTQSHLPVVFTSWRDDTVGEVIGSATGPLTNRAGTLLYFDSYASGEPADVSGARFAYADTALAFITGSGHQVRHTQVLHCTNAFKPYYASVRLRNVLAAYSEKVFNGSLQSTAHVEHATFNVADELAASSQCYLLLTNCLLVAITNVGSFKAGGPYAQESDPATTFQTVGASAHYLAARSPHRNAGTTNIDASLAADLRVRTTYPPTVLHGWLTLDTTLAPHVQRDVDAPDLGYHVDVLDYVWSSVVVSNATVTIEPGTAVGITHWPSGYGLAQHQGSVIDARGTASQPIRLARYNTVQEQANTNWVRAGDAVYPAGWTTPTPNLARFTFTEWTTLAAGGAHLSAYFANPAQVTLCDSRFHGGGINSYRPTLTATNCLFHRLDVGFDDGDTYQMGLNFRHCTFVGGFFYGFHGAADAWTFQDNLFDGVDLTWMFAEVTNDFNGYVTNAVCSRLSPNAAHDTVTNASPAYEAGALGRFHLPTNSIFLDAGSTNAHLLGLYHYTTLTNQVREGTNRVDLGFHVVSLAGTASGSPPADGDADGWADYFEDADGDGVVDASETDWTVYTTRYGIGPGPGLVVFTPLK